MDIIKIYHDKKWTLQFLDALYNSIDIKLTSIFRSFYVKYKSRINLFIQAKLKGATNSTNARR
jgi:hypothetical protein